MDHNELDVRVKNKTDLFTKQDLCAESRLQSSPLAAIPSRERVNTNQNMHDGLMMIRLYFDATM